MSERCSSPDEKMNTKVMIFNGEARAWWQHHKKRDEQRRLREKKAAARKAEKAKEKKEKRRKLYEQLKMEFENGE